MAINHHFEELWELLCTAFDNANADSSECSQSDNAEQPVIPCNRIPEEASTEAVPIESPSTPSDAALLPSLALEEADEPPLELTREIDQQLFDIRKFAGWSGEDAKHQLETLSGLFREQYPDHIAQMETAITEGKKIGRMQDQAQKMGRSGKSQADFDQWLDEKTRHMAPKDRRFFQKMFKKHYARGRKILERGINASKHKKSGKPMSKIVTRPIHTLEAKAPVHPVIKRHNMEGTPFAALHPNDIRALKPQLEWTLLIDESGSYFEDAPQSVKKPKRGRFVGLLIPSINKGIPPLPQGWHAVEQDSFEAIDDAIQPILDAEVGILGIELESLPQAQGERWMDGVGLLIDWVLRLLPVESKTRLKILIENRGVFTAGTNWDLVRRDCIRRLALAFPSQALNIGLSVQVIGKNGNPYNGYVDAIAYTWAATNDCSKARLKQSGLLGTCLLDASQGADARSMLNAWDAFAQGVHLPPDIWWKMLGSPDSRNPAALLSHLLILIGNEAKGDAKVWLPYLQEVKSRMAYGPIDLRTMEPAINWLQQNCPPNAQLLPAMRLVWLTVQLARANHQGEVENQWQQELQQLGDRLLDEAAPLVCQADLHLAVNYTNQFAFPAASKVLARWKDVPPAVPGLRFWTHVQSSIGQHAAFTGDNTAAAQHFRTAMEAMKRLSDPELKTKDLSQTGTYLAIALMDDPGVPDDESRQAIEKIIGNLSDAARTLAASTDPKDRYIHHLLLRWLVHRGDPEVWQAYLSRRNDWDAGDGHPWPLIQLYRGLLLHKEDPAAALKLALDGAQRAFTANQGPTVRLIGACCRIVAASWGEVWPDADMALSQLRNDLPEAVDRIEQISKALQTSQPVLVLLKSILPFNFR